MPLLFSLGMHDSLCAVSERLSPEDKSVSLIWTDVHVASPPGQGPVARTICLGKQQFDGGWVPTPHRENQGVESRRNVSPPDEVDLGEEVRNPSGHQNLGHSDRVARVRAQHRPAEVRRTKPLRGSQISNVADPLAMCRGLVCHHLLRTLPPSQATEYAQGHGRRDVAGDGCPWWVASRGRITKRRRHTNWRHSPCALEDSG